MVSILDPFGDQIGPRRRQDEPKRAIKSFKDPRACIFKNLQKPLVFEGFWGPEVVRDSLRRPNKASKRPPRGSQEAPKRPPRAPKRSPKARKDAPKRFPRGS